MSVKVYDAPTIYRCLNGIIGIYKPAAKKINQVRNAILHNICIELNKLEVREPRRLLAINPGGVHEQILKNVADLSDDVLAVGPRYQIEDFKLRSVAHLGPNTSGVLLFGINNGVKLAHIIQQNRAVRSYHVTGKLGTSTENHFVDSIVTARANYQHISTNRISSLIASLQASHQRKLYEQYGVDIQSQAAYELACKGLIRPSINTQPVIYGIRVIELKKPFFTLEIHAINETESYLAMLIHEIGIELKSVAHCYSLRCTQHGIFKVKDTLLRKDWLLQNILDNINHCKKIIKNNSNFINQNLKISEDLKDTNMKQLNN